MCVLATRTHGAMLPQEFSRGKSFVLHSCLHEIFRQPYTKSSTVLNLGGGRGGDRMAKVMREGRVQECNIGFGVQRAPSHRGAAQGPSPLIRGTH